MIQSGLYDSVCVFPLASDKQINMDGSCVQPKAVERDFTDCTLLRLVPVLLTLLISIKRLS